MTLSSLILRILVNPVRRRYFGSSTFDAENLMNFDRVPPFILAHLKRVYLLLACVFASSTFGYFLNLSGNIGSLFAILGAFLTTVCFSFVAPWREKKRVCLLIVGAFFEGASIGPWFTWFLGVDPGFLVSKLLGISLGFSCFWASFKWNGDARRLIYFRGMVSCGVLVLVWMFAASAVFGGDSAVWMFELYTAIMWFMLYVTVYSQVLVLKTRRGEQDFVNHAMTLFSDSPTVIPNAFVVMCAELRQRWSQMNF